ncbi:hypothetical protein KBA27_05655 [bacterium]|nr:hypothetical protein [bacterium]
MQTKEKEEKFLSPREVRNILHADNQEIVKLCRQASVSPRKNRLGQTIFAYDDVKILRNLKFPNLKSGTALTQRESQTVVDGLLEELSNMQTKITESLSKVIDEKLDGMDEVVVELIRCKTENESLRQKINDLSKENYRLKSDINCYKSIGLGLYLKKANIEDQFDI